MLVVVTPGVCAFLGARIQRDLPSGPLTLAFALALWTAIAGAANGALVGLFAAPLWGVVVGAIWGAMCSLPFIPFLGLVVAAARRTGRARASSLVDRVDRRAVWSGTTVAIALASVVGARVAHAPSPLWRLAALGAVGAAALEVALDVWALRRLAAVCKTGAGWPELPAAPRKGQLEGVAVTDLGLGDDVAVEVVPGGPAYRSSERVVRMLRGSPARARAALGRSISTSGAGLLLCAGALLAQAR